MELVFNAHYTLIAAVLVLFLGRFLVAKIEVLGQYSIPEPVAGGLVAAVVAYGVYLVFDLSIEFNSDLQNTFMLFFFTSIGLGANLRKLVEGGRGLVIFLLIVCLFISVQNMVGMSLAGALGLDPLIGLITGSVTLTGGHGTAGAWGSILESKYNIPGATTLGMASATFGLVLGGLIGGPVARYLIVRNRLATARTETEVNNDNQQPLPADRESVPFEYPQKIRIITADNAITTMGMFAVCLAFAQFMTDFFRDTAFELPTFVWALGCGVMLRNILEMGFRFRIFDRAIDVFGNVSLSLYLAMALLSLKLWQLSDLAIPLMVILTVQVLVMALFASWITFRVMGSNYDAAVLAAGHCGFGMGATPTAIANMQAITNLYGPSQKAFLIVPLVGAFFIDLINVVFIQGLLNVFG